MLQNLQDQFISLPTLKTTVLQFADDTAIITPAHARNIKLIHTMLNTFGEIFGMQTNISKSGHIPIAIPQDIYAILEPIIQCPRLNLPTTYLGLSLSINKPPKEEYLPLVSNVQHRYDGRAGKQLSPAGRLILSKSVLNAMTLHYMQAFLMPAWIIRTIEQITRRFLWKGHTDHFSGGNCLVPWGKITLPKIFGGLGVTDLRLQNWALLTKWLWLASSNELSLWAAYGLQPLNRSATPYHSTQL
jgi:hypothetical protein